MRKIVLHNPPMTGNKAIEERAISLAQYIIDSKDTVRGAAKKFCISKSTVHTEVAKGEIFEIPPIIVLTRNTAYSPRCKVKVAVKV